MGEMESALSACTTRCGVASISQEVINAAISYSLVQPNAQDLGLKPEQELALKTVPRGTSLVSRAFTI